MGCVVFPPPDPELTHKLKNILVSFHGQVQIGDLGLAVLGPVLGSDKAAGTLLWASPELLNQLPFDFKTDMWSLGITILELIDGAVPFHTLPEKEALHQIRHGPAPKPQYPELLPAALCD